MRKLKKVELVGKTRLIPGVGHVVMADEMHEYVAEACEKVGLDWFEAADSALVIGELVTGDLAGLHATEAADANEGADTGEAAAANGAAADKANVGTGTRKKK